MAARRALLLLVSLLLAGALTLAGLSFQQQGTPLPVASLQAEPADARPAVQRLADGLATLDPAGPIAQSVAADLERVEAATADLRHLQPAATVSTDFLDQPQLRDLFVQIFDRDYLPEERETDQRLLVTLGLLRPDQDIVREWLDLYQEQVIGLYDSDTKKLYVVADASPLGPEARVTFSHEYVHALQDQHFSLATVAPKHPDNQDRSLAVHALIEGDATLSMAIYATRQLTTDELAQLGQSGETSHLAQTPLVLRAELLFPYDDGLRLVRQLYSRGGFGAVDQAFADPPQSTEQVLHPEKYDQREAPEPVELPDLGPTAGDEWQVLSSNTLGELYLRVLIEQYSTPATARVAAAGWGGDRWELLTRGEQTALVLRTVWDTERDAQEFFSAYAQGLQARFGPQAQAERSADQVRLRAPGYWISVRQHARGVDVAIAPDAGTGERLDEWMSQSADLRFESAE